MAFQLPLVGIQAQVHFRLGQQAAPAGLRHALLVVRKQTAQLVQHVGIGVYRLGLGRQVGHQLRGLALRTFQLRVARLADALILGLTLRLRHEFTIVSTLVLQQLALDSLWLRSRANDLFFHNNSFQC